ncbi:MAG: hypothetical protein JKY87_06155 [Mariprofundus sp.]|nr:hypothetical protein [Mariprofundus sp.]
MLNLKRHLRSFSRLMIGLFAVQVLAAGFCLFTPESHMANAQDMQMPMSSDMSAHCANTAESGHNSDMACAHCDSPDELISSKVSSLHGDIDFPVAAYMVTSVDLTAALHVTVTLHPPTGPPPSSTFLFHNNQRILI